MHILNVIFLIFLLIRALEGKPQDWGIFALFLTIFILYAKRDVFSNIIKNTINKTSAILVNMQKKHKLIIIAIALSITASSYPIYKHIQEESMLTLVAKSKLSKCKKEKKYSLSSYLKEKCPEFMYYVKYCDNTCEKRAIKEMKRKL